MSSYPDHGLAEGSHVHFHEHGDVRHAHTHDHLESPNSEVVHAHSSRTNEPVDPSPVHFAQTARKALLVDLEEGKAFIFRKLARIVAIRVNRPFTVETDRGVMTGAPGDWLVTNHPDDDGGSDLWSISDGRIKATYEVVTPDTDVTPWGTIAAQVADLVERASALNSDQRGAIPRQRALAITYLEDAMLRLRLAADLDSGRQTG